MINWTPILGALKSEKCVLFLGPDFGKLSNGKGLHEALIEHLKPKTNQNIARYYENEGFFLFPDAGRRFSFYCNMLDFFEEANAGDIYNTIAQLPFHLIINISPDDLLLKAFEKEGLASNFDFYNKTKLKEEIAKPCTKKPLIYNLFGTTEDEESMIMSHDDLFDFLHSILGNNELPLDLRNALVEAKNYIFLGFSFETWYLQIIFRILQLRKENLNFAFQPGVSDETKTFFVDHFKIDFIDLDIDDFISQLFEKCKEKNMLRSASQSKTSEIDEIEELLQNNKINEVLDALKLLCALDSELSLQINFQQNRYNSLKMDKHNSIISTEDANIEQNKIILSIQKIIETVKTEILSES